MAVSRLNLSVGEWRDGGQGAIEDRGGQEGGGGYGI